MCKNAVCYEVCYEFPHYCLGISQVIFMPQCACASEVYGSVSVCVSVCVWTATAAQGSMKCK